MFKNTFIFFLIFISTVFAFPQSKENVKRTNISYSIGPALIYQKSIYKGIDDKIIPVPAFSIRYKKILINGLNLNYQLYKTKSFLTLIGTNLKFSGFDPDDSYYLKGIHKRKTQINLFSSFDYTFKNNFIGIKISDDINNSNNGYEIEFYLGKRVRIANNILNFRLKSIYENLDRANFNYGVYLNEQTFFRPYYNVGSSISFGFDFSYIRNYKKNSFMIILSQKFLDSNIKNSPIIDASIDTTFLISYLFNF